MKFNQLLKIMFRILRPGTALTILLMLISGTAVIFIFIKEWQNTILGYILYVVSAYALTSLIVSIPIMKTQYEKFINENKFINRVKAFLYKNKYSHQIITDVSLRVKISLYSSLSINFIYSGFRLFTAFYYASFWFGAEAVFYIVLSGVRFVLLRNVRKNKGDVKRELLTYRFCGYLLFAMNAALTGVVYQMINHGMSKQYPGLLIYAAAIYAFYFLSDAIIQLIKFRKYKSPLLSAVKTINLAQALVIMFSLQVSMFVSFGGEETQTLESVMNTVTGGLVCCAIFAMAVIMVVNSFNKLKNI